MQAEVLLFFGLLFIVAFLYSSVGHGGASGYLALMAIFAISPIVMKPTALLLNLFVSSVSFFQFYRGGHFRWKIFWPFALTSIPLSFLGGTMSIDNAKFRSFKSLGSVFLKKKKRMIGKSSNTPRIFLYRTLSMLIVPPRKESGMEVRAKGQKIFHLKCPPL